MKKPLKIVLIIILAVIVIIGIILIYNGIRHSVKKTNLEENYPVLKEYPFSLSSVNYNGSVASNANPEELAQIMDGKLTERTGSADKSDDGFYCGDEKAEKIHYESHSSGRNVDGGYWTIYILDCEDLYWVAIWDDSGETIYGPFTK